MSQGLDKRILIEEQMAGLESRLRLLNSRIVEAERFIFARPGHQATISRYNILCHNRSEVLTKIRVLKGRMS